MSNYNVSRKAVIMLAAAEILGLGAGCMTAPMQVAERQIKRIQRQLDRLDKKDNKIALGLYSARRGLDRAQERLNRKREEYEILLERFEKRFGRSIDYEAVKVDGYQLTFGEDTLEGRKEYVLVPVSPNEAVDFVGLEVGRKEYTPVAKNKLRKHGSGLVKFYLDELNVSKTYLREHGVRVVYIDTDAPVQKPREERRERENKEESADTDASVQESQREEYTEAEKIYQERVKAAKERVIEAAVRTRRNMVRQGLDYLEESRKIVRGFYADVEEAHAGVVEEGARITAAWMQGERARRIGELGAARDYVQEQLNRVNEQAEKLFEEIFGNRPQGEEE